MKDVFQQIWELAKPYLKKGVVKDFVVHTEGVIKAMELILKQEEGDERILIPAAILHDVGWCNVPPRLQKSNDREDKVKAMSLHLEYAKPVIKTVLKRVGYAEKQIEKVIDIVIAHKFQDPKEPDKKLLIDADALSDSFKEQFYSDCKSHGITPEKNYNYRKMNKFYTKVAREIFDKELEKRKKEFMDIQN